jgi:hypothetical protein
MGEKEKGKGDEGGKDVGFKAHDVKQRAMGWLLAAKEADRLRAARDGTQKAFDEAIAEVDGLAEGLIATLSIEGRMRAHRIFLPGDARVDATIVEVKTGYGPPSVEAHAVDFVAGG